ncbi:MAG TPA: hypothetical protein DCM40_36455, partial [Maribacter sp.]|nr:hypothetical protein [Maribacter sp.]
EIHAFATPNSAPSTSGTDIPPDRADIANAIVVAIKHLVNPVVDKDGQSALQVEVERCRRVLEDWVEHEDALNAAAEIAADTLMDSLDFTGTSHSKDSGTLSY